MFALLLIVLTCSGTMSYLSQALPDTVLKPVFILIALQITEFAFGLSVTFSAAAEFNKYIPALTMALFPAIAQLLTINAGASPPSEMVTVLARGFVITSILWGQVTLSIINGNRIEACAFFFALSVFTFFGLIHSPEGKVYYNVWDQPSYLPVYACISYALCAVSALVFVPPARQVLSEKTPLLSN